jgi:hypothetical protein
MSNVAGRVQLLYGKLEDAEQRWAKRNPRIPYREYELAGQECVALCEQLAAAFIERRDERELELAEYRERRVWGE